MSTSLSLICPECSAKLNLKDFGFGKFLEKVKKGTVTKIVIAGSLSDPKNASKMKIIAEWLDTSNAFEVIHYAQPCETCTLPDAECYFYQKIRETDVLLIVGQHIGKAVSAEIGFANALGKKVLTYYDRWSYDNRDDIDKCVLSLIHGDFFQPPEDYCVMTCDNCAIIRFIARDDPPPYGSWCGMCMAAEMGEE